MESLPLNASGVGHGTIGADTDLTPVKSDMEKSTNSLSLFRHSHWLSQNRKRKLRQTNADKSREETLLSYTDTPKRVERISFAEYENKNSEITVSCGCTKKEDESFLKRNNAANQEKIVQVAPLIKKKTRAAAIEDVYKRSSAQELLFSLVRNEAQERYPVVYCTKKLHNECRNMYLEKNRPNFIKFKEPELFIKETKQKKRSSISLHTRKDDKLIVFIENSIKTIQALSDEHKYWVRDGHNRELVGTGTSDTKTYAELLFKAPAPAVVKECLTALAKVANMLDPSLRKTILKILPSIENVIFDHENENQQEANMYCMMVNNYARNLRVQLKEKNLWEERSLKIDEKLTLLTQILANGRLEELAWHDRVDTLKQANKELEADKYNFSLEEEAQVEKTAVLKLELDQLSDRLNNIDNEITLHTQIEATLTEQLDKLTSQLAVFKRGNQKMLSNSDVRVSMSQLRNAEKALEIVNEKLARFTILDSTLSQGLSSKRKRLNQLKFRSKQVEEDCAKLLEEQESLSTDVSRSSTPRPDWKEILTTKIPCLQQNICNYATFGNTIKSLIEKEENIGPSKPQTFKLTISIVDEMLNLVETFAHEQTLNRSSQKNISSIDIDKIQIKQLKEEIKDAENRLKVIKTQLGDIESEKQDSSVGKRGGRSSFSGASFSAKRNSTGPFGGAGLFNSMKMKKPHSGVRSSSVKRVSNGGLSGSRKSRSGSGINLLDRMKQRAQNQQQKRPSSSRKNSRGSIRKASLDKSSSMKSGSRSFKAAKSLLKMIEDTRKTTAQVSLAAFTGFGTDQDVPRFLRVHGSVRNRAMGIVELDGIINTVLEIFFTGEFDKLADCFYLCLKKKYGIQAIIAEWGYNIIDALDRYSNKNALYKACLYCVLEELHEDFFKLQRMLVNDLQTYFRIVDEKQEKLKLELSNKKKERSSEEKEEKKKKIKDADVISGKLLTVEIEAALQNFFPNKTSLQLEDLRNALDNDCKVKSVRYERLLDVNGTFSGSSRRGQKQPSAFVNTIREQLIEELETFKRKIIDDVVKEATSKCIKKEEVSDENESDEKNKWTLMSIRDAIKKCYPEFPREVILRGIAFASNTEFQNINWQEEVSNLETYMNKFVRSQFFLPTEELYRASANISLALTNLAGLSNQKRFNQKKGKNSMVVRSGSKNSLNVKRTRSRGSLIKIRSTKKKTGSKRMIIEKHNSRSKLLANQRKSSSKNRIEFLKKGPNTPSKLSITTKK